MIEICSFEFENGYELVSRKGSLALASGWGRCVGFDEQNEEKGGSTHLDLMVAIR